MPSRIDHPRRFGDITGRLFQQAHRAKAEADKQQIRELERDREAEAARLAEHIRSDEVTCMCHYGPHTVWTNWRYGAAPPVGYMCDELRADQLAAAEARDAAGGNGDVDRRVAELERLVASLREGQDEPHPAARRRAPANGQTDKEGAE